MKFLPCFLLIFLLFGLPGCNSSAVKDLIDAAELELNPPERRPIDVARTGVNNFFVNPEFGSLPEQFLEIRDTLGLKFVRVLFAWSNEVQPSPDATPDYSFYDAIVSAIPPGLDVLVVLVHSPNWMADANNWIDGNPRVTWVERWLRPTVTRYAGRPGIIGWEIWNEPTLTLFSSDATLELTNSAKYFELLALGSAVIRSIDPTRLILNAATQSIQQSFPSRLDYNKQLRDLGATSLVDIWNVHYYSQQFENVIRSDGVKDFLNSIGLPIWITESGQEGPNNQLGYVEQAWPFLREEIPGIDRIYYYEFGSPVPPENNFGLRTTNSETPISDLYIHLRDR